MKWLNLISEWWALIVTIAGAIAGVFKWRSQQRSANALLLKEYEELKRQIILFIKQEVKHAERVAEHQRFLIKLKGICPDCYEKAMKQLSDEHESSD